MIAAWALSGRVTHVSLTSLPAEVGSITSAALMRANSSITVRAPRPSPDRSIQV